MSWNIQKPGDYINGPLTVTGSATITGDLTVDTSTLKVDSANNRVGIGLTSPLYPLHVLMPSSGTGVGFRYTGGTNNPGLFLSVNESTTDCKIAAGGSTSQNLVLESSGLECFRYSSSGVFTWSNAGLVAGTAMTLNSTGLGIGASPVGRLNIANTGADVVTSMTAVGVQRWQFIVSNSTAAFSIYDQTNSGTRLLIDTSGNVGVGVTPAVGGGCLQLKSGITFPATQVASSDANTLDDYEEGTWTPTDASGAGLTFTVSNCRYTKVGRLVTVQGSIAYPATANGSNATWGGFPFNSSDSFNLGIVYTDVAVSSLTYISSNGVNAFLLTPGVNVINSTVSGKTIAFYGTYMI